MYTLYIANQNYSSWSLRPWVLLTELGIPFTEKKVSFGSGPVGSNWAAFRAFSPTGRVPCLIDGAITVWDSLAIVEYLADRHVGVWPTGAAARAWARCAAAEMHSGFGELRNRCSMNCGIRVELKEKPPELLKEIERLCELWSEGLTRFDGPFLAGNRLTAVDAFFAPVAFRVQTYGLELDDTSKAYANRLLALPSMQRWYAAGIAETWREPGHEAESKAAGRWLADYRAVG